MMFGYGYRACDVCVMSVMGGATSGFRTDKSSWGRVEE